MKETYSVYFRAGKEEMKFMFFMYAEDVKEIIGQGIKILQGLMKYTGVEKQLIIKRGNKQVFNATI